MRRPWWLRPGFPLYEVARQGKRLGRSRTAILGERDAQLMRLLLDLVLREDSSCVDVGAQRGSVLREIVRLAPHGEHHAFEPLPAFADRLRLEFPGVAVHEVALGDENGAADFHHVATNPGYSGLRRREYPRSDERVEILRVEVRRLDDVVPPGKAVALVKVDVEGAELQVLRGARRTILENRPYVLFEHGSGAPEYYGTTPQMLHDLLVSDCGLDIFTLDGSGPLSYEAFAAIYERGATWNFVARPYRRRA